MGTITGTTIINKVATQLLDVANTRWLRPELLGWLNDAQRQIVLMQPSACSKTVPMPTVLGTRQNIPADGWLLLDVYRNMGATGTIPGRAVRVVSRKVMDAQNPYWHTIPVAGAVTNYIYDIQDQTAFYVYPPSNGSVYLEVNYSQVPADLTAEASPIQIGDYLATVIIDYILFRANAKDAEYAAGVQLSQGYWGAFTAALGYKDKAEAENSPNQSLGPKSQIPPGATS